VANIVFKVVLAAAALQAVLIMEKVVAVVAVATVAAQVIMLTMEEMQIGPIIDI